MVVKMQLEGLSYQKINKFLSCSSSFISKWKKIFSEQGIEGLKLKYKGGKSYLSAEQEIEVIEWIERQNWLTRETLEQHIEIKYSVIFASLQSYYELLKKGGMSWKKSQKNNPRRNDDLVELKKKEIKKNWQNINKI
jgi:putative transposase